MEFGLSRMLSANLKHQHNRKNQRDKVDELLVEETVNRLGSNCSINFHDTIADGDARMFGNLVNRTYEETRRGQVLKMLTGADVVAVDNGSILASSTRQVAKECDVTQNDQQYDQQVTNIQYVHGRRGQKLYPSGG